MPLTRKGRKTLEAMKRHYGADKGEEVFYKSINAGRLHGMEMRRRRKEHRKEMEKHHG